jgi:hypothetical protein
MLRRLLFLVFALLVILPVVRVAGQEGFAGPRDEGDVQAQSVQHISLPGRVLGNLNLRTAPQVSDDTLIRTLQHNEPVNVLESVVGADGETWYRVGDGEFVYAADVRLPSPPPQGFTGRWIDVDLNTPALLTAYEDDEIVFTALAIKGRGSDQTPVGTHTILRRVANETMDSRTTGIPRNAPNGYYLQNVLFTQYFANDGASIHYNYWSSSFGEEGSHGCLGLSREDAEWIWNFADVGTVVNIHY